MYLGRKYIVVASTYCLICLRFMNIGFLNVFSCQTAYQYSYNLHTFFYLTSYNISLVLEMTSQNLSVLNFVKNSLICYHSSQIFELATSSRALLFDFIQQ